MAASTEDFYSIFKVRHGPKEVKPLTVEEAVAHRFFKRMEKERLEAKYNKDGSSDEEATSISSTQITNMSTAYANIMVFGRMG